MLLYLSTIFICMVIISILNIIISKPIFGFEVWYIVVAVVICTVSVFVWDIIIATIVRFSPKKLFNPFAKYYKVHKFEKNFYEKLGIKKWKDKIPELGKIAGFRKDVVLDVTNNEYVYKFLTETCIAEIMHKGCAILGFLIIFIYPLKYVFCFALPVAFVNFVLHLLPVFVQRYTRPKLEKIYQINAKKSQSN